MLDDPKSSQSEVEIEIPEAEVVVEKEEIEIDFSDASKEEQALAKKHGFIKEEPKDGEHKESAKPAAEVVEQEEKEEVVENPTFEQIEANEKLIDKYNRNEKALYWKWKTDKAKRQEAQKKLNEVTEQFGLDRVKAVAYEKKLEKLNNLLNSDVEDLTVEKLRAVLQEKEDMKSLEVPNVVGTRDIEKIVKDKAQYAEKIGMAKYDNFEGIARLAKEIIDADKSGTYQSLLDKSFTDESVDESMLVDRIVSIAKLSDKFNEVSNVVASEKKETVDRVLKNSKKKISSASIAGSGGRRIISHADLTIEDAAKLTKTQWAKLPEQTKRRLLAG